MKQSKRERLRELQIEKENSKWEEAEIHNSQMDPDMKAICLNDLQYRVYCIEQEIENIEHDEGVFPLKLMLLCFIIFTLVLVLYRISH